MWSLNVEGTLAATTPTPNTSSGEVLYQIISKSPANIYAAAFTKTAIATTNLISDFGSSPRFGSSWQGKQN